MTDGGALVVGVVLLLGNAFFVAASFAMVSVRRSQIQPVADAGSRQAKATLRAIQQVSRMMAGAQLGITICTLGLGALTEPALARLLEPVFGAIGVPEEWLHPVAFVPALLIVISLHVVIGEMVPKNLTLAAPDQAALGLGPVLAGWVRIMRPVVVGLNAVAAGFLRLFKVYTRDEVTEAVTQEEVGILLAESRREGLIDPDQHDRTAEALLFAERRVIDAAVPVDELVSISATATAADVEALAGRTGHSRFPRYDAEQRLSGYVHLRDVLSIPRALRYRPVPLARVRPVSVVRVDATLVDVVAVLRADGAHVARVDRADESTAGVVTLDGILLQLIPDRSEYPESAGELPELSGPEPDAPDRSPDRPTPGQPSPA